MSKIDDAMDDDEAQFDDENNEQIEDDSENEDEDIESDDDDDDEKEEEIEHKDEEKLKFLKESIEQNKFAYQNYVDLIQLLRTYGDLDNLRVYREKMSEVFPLTESMWLDWLRDEQKFVDSSEDRQRLYNLFERAIQDYLSVDVWLEYIQFSIGGLNEPNGMEKIRSICERAIAVAGYHVKKGFTLWEAYREFEMAILAGLQQSLAGNSNTKQLEADINQQTNRIVKLLKRQLKVCLDDMDVTFEELKQLDETQVNDELIKIYEKTVEKYKELEKYENNLENTTIFEEKLAHYKAYLKYELKQNESYNYIEPRIHCLFERTLADGQNCLDPTLWLQYTTYLCERVKSDQDRDLVLQVYKRALRNTPWCGKLWINYALELEHNDTSISDLKKIYNEAMNAGLQTSVEYLELWHAYLDFLRRSLYNKDKKTATDEEIESLRDTFQRAINQLFEFFKHEGDPNFTLEKYWAYCEAKYFKNMEQARKIWNEMIMQKGMNQISSVWIEFFEFEMQFGDEKHQRKVLIRALNEANDSKDHLCELFLKFEKQNGNIDTYMLARLKCDQIISEINEENARKYEEQNKQKQNNKQSQQQQKQQTKQKQKQNQKPQQQKQQQQQRQQTKPEGKEQDNKNLKRKKSEEEVQTKAIINKVDKEGFAIPNVPISNVILPSPKKLKGEDEKHETAKSTPTPTPTSSDTSNKKNQFSNNSVFLSNLAYDVKVEDVENVLKHLPGFKAVRLVQHFSGKTKGYGYADFDTQNNAVEALKHDRTQVNGRPMFISQCEDKSMNFGISKFKYPTGMEKNKLFISNLPFSVDKPQLEKLFETFGKLKEVRIVTYKNGKSKGLAYVEFEDEAAAAKALIQTDNMLVGDNQISVAISNPPRRNQQQTESDKTSTVTSSLGSGAVKSGATSQQRKGLMSNLMQPRSVATKSLTKPKDETMQVDEKKDDQAEKFKNIQLKDDEKQKPLSNEDFRAFLLNKK